MSQPPLTHHEILTLVEPFTRRGRHVDLAASDRIARRLAFKPVDRDLAGDGGGDAFVMQETLLLDCLRPDAFRLTRRIAGRGLEASLVAEGTQPGELLERVDAVPAARHFVSGSGFVVAKSLRLEPGAGMAPRLTLTGGSALAGGLAVTLTLATVRGMTTDLQLEDRERRMGDLPDDLLAVLGWSWARLNRTHKGWSNTLRLSGSGVRRSEDAEAKFERTARHLARTFAETPARFHDRWRWARWGVALRRAVPLLACIALVYGVTALPSLGLSDDSVARMLIFNLPPVLLILVFCMRELPRIEIPPPPRRLTTSSWREGTSSSAPAELAEDAAGR